MNAAAVTVTAGGSAIVQGNATFNVLSSANGQVSVNGVNSQLRVGGVLTILEQSGFQRPALLLANAGLATAASALLTSATVESGSRLSIANQLAVGGTGSGTIAVNAGGTLTAGSAQLNNGLLFVNGA